MKYPTQDELGCDSSTTTTVPGQPESTSSYSPRSSEKTPTKAPLDSTAAMVRAVDTGSTDALMKDAVGGMELTEENLLKYKAALQKAGVPFVPIEPGNEFSGAGRHHHHHHGTQHRHYRKQIRHHRQTRQRYISISSTATSNTSTITNPAHPLHSIIFHPCLHPTRLPLPLSNPHLHPQKPWELRDCKKP